MYHTHTSSVPLSSTYRFFLWNNRHTRNINKEKENYHYAIFFVFVLSLVIWTVNFHVLVVMQYRVKCYNSII